ncbi:MULTISPECIES: ABC transporter permease [Actinoplanes]|uniref:ABC transporter permease n=1 Tax=Actinoplanes TaxID=1865 RepID=UPI0005F2C8D6|nr:MULTISPECIES: ABC transporter permease [Actinoplanes]GLY05176.1 ABC transporter permease [Actinoplanes sp. NBRC 101535]
MITYIIRRLFAAVVLLFIISAATFSIFYMVPRLLGGTPETLATRYVGRAATPETVHLIAEKLGFYDPIWVQYGSWVKAIFVGADYDLGASVEHCAAPCFGYSFITHNAVWPELIDRLPVTLSLAIGAAILWMLLGLSIGTLSALRRGSFLDRAAMTFSLAGVSLPIFFTGMIGLLLFSYTLGWTAPGGTYTPFLENPGEWFYALLLPWIVLALQFSAQYARLTRAGMLETMGEDYIRTARAKGLRERDVTVKHGLRAALTPILTIFGLDFGLLLGGAVLTEQVFSLPGLGKYAVDAITNNDLPKVLGVTLMAAFFVVVANLIVDLFYAVVDPRVRLG